MSRATVLLFGAVACFAATSRLEAGTITLGAIDSGSYQEVGGNLGSSTQYFIGIPIGGLRHRNFFVFDLSGISEVIIGAELRVYGGTVFGNTGGVPIRFSSVTTPIADLLARQTGVSIFNDLGAGPSFGDFLAAPTIVNSFALNATAVTDLESAKGGLWAVGGMAVPPATGSIFVNTGGDVVRQLVLTTSSDSAVPEPTSFVLALGGGLGALGIVGVRRRAKKHPRPVEATCA